LVARLYTSRALPLLRLSNTYHAFVSTVAAAAGDANTAAAATVTSTAAMPAATTRGNHQRRRDGERNRSETDMVILQLVRASGGGEVEAADGDGAA
jgi:hypothetical protein